MKIVILLLALLSSPAIRGQYGHGGQSARIFYDIKEALQTPKEVLKLYLDHHDLEKLPPNIVKFQNLRELQLGGNTELDWENVSA